MTRKWRLLIALGIGFFWIAGAAHATTHEFYKGKTVRIIVGTTAGGGFDIYARAIARHMGKHIPGNPTIIVENMPGAGHLIAANHLFKVAKPDGLTIGNVNGGQIMNQVLGRPGIEFDGPKFEYVGVPVVDMTACVFSKASGINSMEKWMASKTPVKLGGMAPGTLTDDVPKLLKAALDLPIQLVSGYKGGAEIRLATEGGEVAGGCLTWNTIKTSWSKAVQAGDAVVVLQIAAKPQPDLPKVPLGIQFAKTDEARQLINAGIHDLASIVRAYLLPPATPKERVQILRKAFVETLKDPEFLADAEKSKLDIDPVTGEEMEKIVAGLFKLAPSVVARLKEVLFK